MKNKPIALLLLLLFIYPSGSFSQEGKTENDKNPGKEQKIKWYSFEDAYKMNKKRPRKIFIDVYTDWCGWCKKMDAETFANPVIVAYMNKEFYCVKLNAEMKDTLEIDGVRFVNPGKGRSTHQLANELLKGKMSYPSYVFLNEKSQWLTVVPGYQSPAEFEPVIHYFGEDAYLKTPWEEYRSNFKRTVK